MIKRVLLVLIALTVLFAVTPAAQSGHALFQQALTKERAEGKLLEAIRIYERIAKEFAADRPLAAKALVQMGRCYEKLGRGEARKAYERVVQEYADQRDLAAEARTRLSGLVQPATTAAGVPTARRVWADFPLENTAMFFGSPIQDGRSVVFIDWQTGDVAVRDLVAGQTRRVTRKGSWAESTEFGLSPVASRDGRSVAVLWLNKEGVWDLRVLAMDGSTHRVLLRLDEKEWPWIQPVDWSPDGKRILGLLSRNREADRLVVVSVDDGAVKVLNASRAPGRAVFSPDGTQIAYDAPARGKTWMRDVFLVAADGSRETPVDVHPSDDMLVGWTPDGRRIVFVSDRTGAPGVWAVGMLNGRLSGAPELIRPEIGVIHPLGFTATGSLMYGVRTGIREAYVAEIDPATGTVVAPPAPAADRFLGANRSPRWSPDGQYLAYVSNRTRRRNQLAADTLCIRSAATGETRDLSPGLDFMNAIQWYPDGRALLVQVLGEQGGLYRVESATGAATPVKLAGADRVPKGINVSPDARTLYVLRDAAVLDQPASIVAIDLSTGSEREVCQHVWVRGLTLSPDGSSLLFYSWDKAAHVERLLIVPSSGGAPREILSIPGPERTITAATWLPDSRGVLYGRARTRDAAGWPGPTEIWRVSIEAGQPQPRKLALSADAVVHLDVNRDGRRVAFVAGRPKGELWVMDNLVPNGAAKTAARR